LIRYAGLPDAGRPSSGDPSQVSMTSTPRSWLRDWHLFRRAPVDDRLPLRAAFLQELPTDAVLQVTDHAPELYWFPTLRLRWHAVPAISNMDMHIGGITYGAAPFNGWYMGTEIGARNFADVERYNLLPTIAHMMGLDTSSERTLWRDRALVELNIAVLHSFGRGRRHHERTITPRRLGS